MLEKLFAALKSQPKFQSVRQVEDYLEISKYHWQIFWSESLDDPNHNCFFCYEDGYGFLVVDSVKEVLDGLHDILQ